MKTATTTQPCACDRCNCTVNLETAVMKDGKAYCCEGCASGSGCQCSGCSCGKG